MSRSHIRFILIALAIGWAVDLLFFKQPLGLNFLLWSALILAGGIFLIVSEKKKPGWQTWLLMVVVLAAAALPFLRMDIVTRFAGMMLALAGLLFIADTALNGHWLYQRISDWVLMIFRLIAAAFARPRELFKPAAGEEASSPPRAKSVFKVIGRVLLGLLLALPVVVVLGSLLSSADPIFSDQVARLLENLRLEKLVEYAMRLCYVLVIAYFVSGLLLHAVLPAKETPRPDPQTSRFKPFLGFLETNIILGAVLVLFAAFVAVQFRYLFGGEAHLQAMGYTYSEYAVKGFEELVMVAVLSLGLYHVLATLGKRRTPARERSYTILSVVLLALVMIILGSSWMRLRMYENAYGFTLLRTYTHFFIPWLGALLLTVLVLEIIKRRGHFALALFTMAIGFGLTLGLVNVQGYIVRQNVARAEAGKNLDVGYLTQLYWDAVPVLHDLFINMNAKTSPAYDNVGASLACYAASMKDTPDHDWRGASLSEIQAHRIFSDPGNKKIWNWYPVTWIAESHQYVVKIGNELVPCGISGYID